MSGPGPVCLGGGAAVPLHQGPRHKRRAMCALLIFKLSVASFQQSEKYRSTSTPQQAHTSTNTHLFTDMLFLTNARQIKCGCPERFSA